MVHSTPNGIAGSITLSTPALVILLQLSLSTGSPESTGTLMYYRDTGTSAHDVSSAKTSHCTKTIQDLPPTPKRVACVRDAAFKLRVHTHTHNMALGNLSWGASMPFGGGRGIEVCLRTCCQGAQSSAVLLLLIAISHHQSQKLSTSNYLSFLYEYQFGPLWFGLRLYE